MRYSIRWRLWPLKTSIFEIHLSFTARLPRSGLRLTGNIFCNRSDHSKHLTEAIAKLEKLKALQYYDVDTTLHVLMAEVDVDILRGDFEEVRHARILTYSRHLRL